MITAQQAYDSIIADIQVKVEEWSKRVANDVMQDYSTQFPNVLGEYNITYRVSYTIAKRTLTSLFLAKGQKALIAEYGRGSEMASDDENPNLAEYLSSKVFNKDRMKFSNNPITTRLRHGQEEYYYDLDNKPIPYKSKALVKLEGKGKHSELYKPIKAPFTVRTIIKENLHNIIADIITAVVRNQAIRNMIDGLEIKIKL